MIRRLSRGLRSTAKPAQPAPGAVEPLGELPPRPDVGVQTPASSGGRAGQVFGAVRISYAYQAIILVAGLWLTPFLITRLGEAEYGLWIAGTQIVTWLYVMDLGVVALLPRETAHATGRAATTGAASEVPRLIDRTMMLLLWQLPLVALATLVVWLLLPAEYRPLSGPLLLVFGTFVLGFPFRIFQAVLTGVQDLVYVSVITSIGWSIGFVLTVVLVRAGLGLYALAFSFAVVQVFQFAGCGIRLRTRYRNLLPKKLAPLSWKEAKTLLMSGIWVSVAQLAQVLLVGTDLLIIAYVLGPEAVVPYAITGKLITVLATQPGAFAQAALPGIAEIRGGEDMPRMQRAASASGQAMLIVSGIVFCVVLVVNEAFVQWWGVPGNPYAGDLLTGLLLLSMTVRHANHAIILTLFALGGEKRISITTLADGFVTVIGTIALVREFGVLGAPIGALLGTLLVSLPANLAGLSKRAGIPVVEWLRPHWGWGWRFTVLAVAGAALSRQRLPATFLGLAIGTTVVVVVVVAVMLPVALRPPLGTYVIPRLRRFLPRAFA